MAGVVVQQGQRSRTNRWILIAAAALGLLTAVLVVAYVNQQTQQQKANSTATVPVIVAKQNIPLGTTITAAMVAPKLVTPGDAVATAFVQSSQVIGQRSRSTIAGGAQIVPAMVIQAGSSDSLSFVVPPGKRGVAVATNDVIADGNHIRPGDFVDVIAILDVTKLTGAAPPANVDKPQGVYTILQDIEVLAVADNAEKVAASGPQGTNTQVSNAAGANNSVTLAVNPAQAELLFLAGSEGKIQLSLRPAGEQDQPQIPPVVEPLTSAPPGNPAP